MKIRRIDVIVHFIFTLLLLVATVFVIMNMSRRIPAYAVAVAVYSINNLRLSRCPHCKKFGLHPNPFKDHAGNCKYCGELVEYDTK